MKATTCRSMLLQNINLALLNLHIFRIFFSKLLSRTFAKKQPFQMHKKARIFGYKFRKIKSKTTFFCVNVNIILQKHFQIVWHFRKL